MKAKRMRKGIIMLVVAAATTMSAIGSGSSAQASTVTNPAGVSITISAKAGPLAPQARGSVWM